MNSVSQRICFLGKIAETRFEEDFITSTSFRRILNVVEEMMKGKIIMILERLCVETEKSTISTPSRVSACMTSQRTRDNSEHVSNKINQTKVKAERPILHGSISLTKPRDEDDNSFIKNPIRSKVGKRELFGLWFETTTIIAIYFLAR